ncbi:MAG: NAD(P)-dependent oxidoreductase, partial [Raoultibacter sp.]
GAWARSIDFSYWNTPLIEIAGKTIGIIGMGSIGQAVAKVASAFGMEVLFYNRSAKPTCESEHCTQVDLDELLVRADIVTLHAPASPETNGLIDATALAQMKDGAMLLNTARGALVNERDVADALLSGKLGGFGADVVAIEPMSADSPLLEARGTNIVITPHIAWATTEARTRLLDTVRANIQAFIDGSPQNVVS